MTTVVHKILASFGAIGVLSFLALIVASFIGYFMNIYKLVSLAIAGGPVDNVLLLIGRVIGLWYGWIGGILGYF